MYNEVYICGFEYNTESIIFLITFMEIKKKISSKYVSSIDIHILMLIKIYIIKN